MSPYSKYDINKSLYERFIQINQSMMWSLFKHIGPLCLSLSCISELLFSFSPPLTPLFLSLPPPSLYLSLLFCLFSPGCEELASQFLSQEIDGQALLLLKEEHLMSTMNIKLGPALKICAHINNLRD